MEEWVGYDGGAVREWHRNARQIRVASDVTAIPDSAFRACGNLRAVDLGNVTNISARAFNGCRSLQRVVWTTASAVEIGKWAFAYCMNLAEIDLRTATKIGAMAFYCCKALTNVTIPSSVAAIEAAAFHCCENLVDVELCEGIQRIGKHAFLECNALVRISIPPSVTDIEFQAFRNCNRLADVELNAGLQRIGAYALQGCASLASISVPSTTLKVADHAFGGCSRLCHVELQEGLQSIGSWAFKNCTSLSEVTLREGFHDIDADAFIGCTSLENINIPPVALVINVESSNCRLMRGTMPITPGRKLLISKWLQYSSPSQLTRAKAKVREILRRIRQTEGQKIRCIREWFAYYYRLDVTTMLELAIWRCNMESNEQNAEIRQAIRRSCGGHMNVIIPSVLPFLEG